MHKLPLEYAERFRKLPVEEGRCLCVDLVRDSIVCTSDRTSDRRNRVGIAADGDCVAYGILERIRFKECFQGLRNGTIAFLSSIGLSPFT